MSRLGRSDRVVEEDHLPYSPYHASDGAETESVGRVPRDDGSQRQSQRAAEAVCGRAASEPAQHRGAEWVAHLGEDLGVSALTRPWC